MKKLSIIIGVVAALAVPATVKAQQYVQDEVTAELYPNSPDSPEIQVPQGSTQYAVASLLRTEGTTAGADSKEMTTPAASATGASEEGFSEPTAYSEYRYAHIQDNRLIGFDGDQHNGLVGFDFESYFDTIVGFNFTYTNSNLATSFTGTNFTDSINSYFFSTYVAKNFDDWVNVGGSATYGRSDGQFLAQFPGGGAFGQDTTQDSCALSPFVGVAHTWGAFSFSSTATYLWGYDHYEFEIPSPGGGTAPPNAKTLNQTFLLLNNFQYAVTDKLSVSTQINWTRLLTIESVPTVPSTTLPPPNNMWMTFGARADYAFNKDGTVYGVFEHDAFDTHFDDWRIRAGVNYNF